MSIITFHIRSLLEGWLREYIFERVFVRRFLFFFFVFDF